MADGFQKTVDELITKSDGWLNPLKNKDDKCTTPALVTIVVLVLYIVFVAPALEYDWTNVFDNIFVKLALLLLVVLLARVNPAIAIIAGIAFVVTLMTANSNKWKKLKEIELKAKSEKKENMTENLKTNLPVERIRRYVGSGCTTVTDNDSQSQSVECDQMFDATVTPAVVPQPKSHANPDLDPKSQAMLEPTGYESNCYAPAGTGEQPASTGANWSGYAPYQAESKNM
jgi:hypothetical protein